MNNKFNEANLIPRMAQIVLNSQEMKDIKEKIEAVGDDVESIQDDMESILNGVSTRFPDHVLAKEGDDTKLVSISRLIELMAIYQLDPLKEDPSRIWFEIDVATSGDFKMWFEDGRAWLDTTELTSNVAVPDVAGKHVVIIEESVTVLDISNNRLKGDLTINGLTSVSSFNCSENQLTSLNLPLLTSVVYSFCCRDSQLTSLSIPSLTLVDGGIYFEYNQLTSQSIEHLLHVLLNVESSEANLNISGGTNAAYSTWSQQAQDDFPTLQNLGWAITYNQ